MAALELGDPHFDRFPRRKQIVGAEDERAAGDVDGNSGDFPAPLTRHQKMMMPPEIQRPNPRSEALCREVAASAKAPTSSTPNALSPQSLYAPTPTLRAAAAAVAKSRAANEDAVAAAAVVGVAFAAETKKGHQSLLEECPIHWSCALPRA